MFLSQHVSETIDKIVLFPLSLPPPTPISLYETRLSFQLGPQTSSSQHVSNDRFNFIIPLMPDFVLRNTPFVSISSTSLFPSSLRRSSSLNNVETIDIILSSFLLSTNTAISPQRNTYFVSISSTNFFADLLPSNKLGTRSLIHILSLLSLSLPLSLPPRFPPLHAFRFNLSSAIPSFLQFCSQLLATVYVTANCKQSLHTADRSAFFLSLSFSSPALYFVSIEHHGSVVRSFLNFLPRSSNAYVQPNFSAPSSDR